MLLIKYANPAAGDTIASKNNLNLKNGCGRLFAKDGWFLHESGLQILINYSGL